MRLTVIVFLTRWLSTSSFVVNSGLSQGNSPTTLSLYTGEGNLLETVQSLHNDYYALRHGQSKANVAGIIMSDPSIACTDYGLSNIGKEQASVAAHDARQVFESGDYESLVILSSDLLRAFETATQVLNKNRDLPIHQEDVIVETRIRERWFGEWDGKSDENYSRVWQEDFIDASHTNKGVESVYQVMERTTRCVLEWDSALFAKYSKSSMVILVAHGDVLQILQTAFEKKDCRFHRDLQHLETAQLRQLNLAS